MPSEVVPPCQDGMKLPRYCLSFHSDHLRRMTVPPRRSTNANRAKEERICRNIESRIYRFLQKKIEIDQLTFLMLRNGNGADNNGFNWGYVDQVHRNRVPELIILSDDDEESEKPQVASTQVASTSSAPSQVASTSAAPSQVASTSMVATQVVGAQPVELAQILEFYDPRGFKIWCFQDPEGLIQGPFSLCTLKLWKDAGFYPPGLKVWEVNRAGTDVYLTDLLCKWFPVF